MPDSNKNPKSQIIVAPIFLISGREIKPQIETGKDAEQQTYSQASYTDLNLKSGSFAQNTKFEPKEVADALQELAKLFEELAIDSISLTQFLNKSDFSCKVNVSGLLFCLTIQRIQGKTRFKLTLDDFELDPIVLNDGFIAGFESKTEISIGKIFANAIDNLPNEIKDLKIKPKSGLVVYQKEKSDPAKPNTSKFIFGLDLGIELPALTDLPLIGDKLPSDKSLAIDSFRFLIISADFTQEQLKRIQDKSADYTAIDKYLKQSQTLSKGGSLSTILRFGEEIYPIDFSMAGTTTPKTIPAPKITPAPAPTPTTASENADTSPSQKPQSSSSPNLGTTKWFNVQKKVGPVSFNRVGVRYYEKLVWLLLDMALSASDLTLSLNGLAVGFDVLAAFKNPKALLKPRFRLDGIGLQYTGKGPLQIGGAFLREQITLANGQIVDQYSGAALIRTEAFSLTAIGSYTEINGSPSLFIYAFLDRSLGGPPFFFVTGLALGFGYNRSLRTPTAVEEVASFPLVRLVLNATPSVPKEHSSSSPSTALSKQEKGKLSDVLGQLQSYIPPDPGKIFLAVGVKFTSFKLIDSFALLIATFGDEFRLKLLGISKIVAPPPATGQPPIAEVSIGLIAEFVPKEGILKVDGKILPGAYVFSRDCQISGGFAFYSWFSGPHAGDFVLIVGGYHPRFNIPAHYPKVDRFRLNWQVDSNLSIKGSAYFALTSSAVMAGGSLEAYFAQDELQAWFNFNADFLVAWQPFYYEAEISIGIRVSYRTFLKTFEFSIGVFLRIWGPEFQGIARVNLKIVQFDIKFGKQGNSKPNPLTWAKFKEAFLPSDRELCTLSAKDGLSRTFQDQGQERWIINPKDLVLQIDTVIPCTREELSGNSQRKLNTILGVGSMAVSPGDFTSTLSLEVKRDSKRCEDDFSYTPLYKSVPSALWGTKLQPDLNDKPIPGALCGFEIRPATPPAPGDTNDIKCSVLAYNDDGFPKAFSWQASTASQIDREASAKINLKTPNQILLEGLDKWIATDASDPLDQDLDRRLIDEFLEVPQVIMV
ncbi:MULTISPECIES: DUF6603 domain-containing protein [Leptolyngbya]|uniref:DUF6603 domain-containing protein n=1 Tax=Leptolyngbya TaxID=47251 RepID=UPI001686B92B|nr:DUF6603 domain-containing protein [Leptolyngbya sp. FACHB-1624]MBD1857653.1 hypothetical protein [Leptolyngbya sp. FACHB-1624]